MNEKALAISFKHGISVSTLYRWYSQFHFNSANFQLEEYHVRLGEHFPNRGIELFQILLNFFKKHISDSDEDCFNLFIHLQELLATPFQYNGEFRPSMGIFRTILDRGG